MPRVNTSIFIKHAYGSTDATASTFLQWANIEKLIKEGYEKSNKKFIESTSRNDITWVTFPSIKVEVDMWRTIGVANRETSKLRIIVDYDGNVVSSYPIDNFSIQ